MIIDGDPTFILIRTSIYGSCKAVAKGSNHQSFLVVVIVRGREILGDGRSVLAS